MRSIYLCCLSILRLRISEIISNVVFYLDAYDIYDGGFTFSIEWLVEQESKVRYFLIFRIWALARIRNIKKYLFGDIAIHFNYQTFNERSEL